MGADAGGAPEVKVFGGSTLGGLQLHDFNAGSATFRGRLRVAGDDVNGDGPADVITGACATPPVVSLVGGG